MCMYLFLPHYCVPLTEDPSPGLHVEVGEDVGPTRRGLPHRAGDGGDRTGDHGQPAERQRDHRQNEGQGESVVQIKWPRLLGAPGRCSLVLSSGGHGVIVRSFACQLRQPSDRLVGHSVINPCHTQ